MADDESPRLDPEPSIDYQQLASTVAGNQDTGGNYTTPHAREVAESFLDQYKGYMSSDDPEQKALFAGYGKSAAGAREILQRARERIANMQRPEDTLRALAMQQGVDEPIQGHDYGALFGHVREKLLQNKLDATAFENQRQEKLTEIDQAINATDDKSLAARLQLLKEKITQSGQLAGKAMTVFGKIDAPNKYNTPGASGATDPANPALRIWNGYQAGVPELEWDPFQAIADPKQKAQAIMAETKAGLANLDKTFAATAQQQQARVVTVDEMERLAATGKIRWGSGIANVDSAIGNRLPAAFYNDAEQAYLKDSQVLARQARMPGERYSQWDGKILQSMVPSLANDASTATFMRKSIKAAAQNTLDYINFKKNYIEVHGTDTGDADKAWDEYVNSPEGRIFGLPEDGQVPKDITKIGLNDKRIPWKQYFQKQYEAKYPGIATTKAFADGGHVITPSKVLDMFHQYKDGMTGDDDGDFSDRIMSLRARYASGGQVTPTADELSAYLSGKISRPGDSGGAEPEYVRQAMRDAIADSSDNMGMGAVTSVAAGMPGALPAAAWLASRFSPSMDYNAGMRKLRHQQGTFDREYPHVPTTLAGSFLTPGVGQLYGWAGRGGNLLARVGKMGLANASLGAAYGASDANPGNRLSAAGTGALDNMILGPILGRAGQLGAKYGIRGLRGLGGWAGSALDANLGTNLGETLRNPTSAEERLSGALRSDTGSPGGAVPGASLLDAGPDTHALIRDAARRDPGARETIAGALDERDAARRQGADTLLNTTFAPSEPFGEEARILQRLKDQSNANWATAYRNGTNIPGGPAIERLTKSPTGMQAIQDAGRTLADRGQTPPMLGGANATPLTTEFLDEVRQQLESQYQRAGTPGHKAAISTLKKDLTQHLRDNNPDFATAMDEHADDQRLLGALQLGRDKFHTMSPAEVDLHINGNGTNTYPGLNFSEKDAFLSGAIGDLQKRLLAKNGNPDVAGSLLSTPGTMEKFGTLLNDPNKLQRFKEGLQGLSDQHANDTQIRKGLGIPPPEDPTKEAKTGLGLLAGLHGHAWWGASAAADLWRNIRNMKPETARDISDMVSETDPAKIREIQARLLQQGVKPQMLQNAMNKGRGAGAIQGAISSAPRFTP